MAPKPRGFDGQIHKAPVAASRDGGFQFSRVNQWAMIKTAKATPDIGSSHDLLAFLEAPLARLRAFFALFVICVFLTLCLAVFQNLTADLRHPGQVFRIRGSELHQT
jgi:hypothetical protein